MLRTPTSNRSVRVLSGSRESFDTEGSAIQQLQLLAVAGKPIAYNLWATLPDFWATFGYSSLFSGAAWLSRHLHRYSRFRESRILEAFPNCCALGFLVFAAWLYL